MYFLFIELINGLVIFSLIDQIKSFSIINWNLWLNIRSNQILIMEFGIVSQNWISLNLFQQFIIFQVINIDCPIHSTTSQLIFTVIHTYIENLLESASYCLVWLLIRWNFPIANFPITLASKEVFTWFQKSHIPNSSTKITNYYSFQVYESVIYPFYKSHFLTT